ncbi:MAG: hypothetical protein ACD_41C00034G0002 [uncultured bacterium]|nr:MAG: hypothetical protein ACD_41C00034G0002 [uncultured bacterium]
MPLIPDIRLPTQSSAKPPVKSPVKTDRPAVVIRPPKVKARRWSGRRWKIIAGSGALIVAVGLYCSWQSYRLYTAGLAAKNDFVAVQADLTAKDFVQAKVDLQSGTDHIAAARRASRGLWPIKWLPWVHKQFVVVDQLLLAGQYVGTAGQPLLDIVKQVNDVVGDQAVTVNKIGKAEREALLKTIYESPETVLQAQADLHEAVLALKELPTAGVIAPLRVVVDLVQTNLPTLEAGVDKGLPFLTVAPSIAGYPETKTYLFLLQNNTELRPTGGFIGTYGILKLKQGSIEEFKTDNIYNIDGPVKDSWTEIPPAPLQRYLSASKWFLRDVNWDPNFPATAERAIDFYLRELQSDQRIDGVIAVTPELIHDLLEVTGPIEIDGDEYNADNLTETLQYEVEIAFYNEGKNDSTRKEVIGKLAGELLDRVMNLPQSSWDKLAAVLITNLEEKHILVYSTETAVQQLVGKIGWDGSIAQTTGDFLMVVDANLAAKKTDRVMTKNMEYTVRREGADTIATLTLRYRNDGVFDDFTTRYRSYLRVYVPTGSELLDSSGFLTTDRYLGGEPTTATTSQAADVDKTVWEGFISVEPKSEETITLQYRLPQTVTDQIAAGTYELFWEKQAGTDNVTATILFDVDKKVRQATTLDESAEIDNTEVHFTTQLLRDLQLTIDLK